MKLKFMKCIGSPEELEVIKARITEYQEKLMFHPLTCGNDSQMHRDLVAEIRGDQLILKCLDCDYLQEYIPDLFKYKWRSDINEN